MPADGADIGLRLVPYALAQLRRVEIQYLGIRRHIAVVKDIGDRALDFVARLGRFVGVAVSFDDLGGGARFPARRRLGCTAQQPSDLCTARLPPLP